jgi:hypothetical protein
MSKKRNVVLYLDKDLVEKTRNLGFNLGKTFENTLKQPTIQFSSVNSMNNSRNDRGYGVSYGRRDSPL